MHDKHKCRGKVKTAVSSLLKKRKERQKKEPTPQMSSHCSPVMCVLSKYEHSCSSSPLQEKKKPHLCICLYTVLWHLARPHISELQQNTELICFRHAREDFSLHSRHPCAMYINRARSATQLTSGFITREPTPQQQPASWNFLLSDVLRKAYGALGCTRLCGGAGSMCSSGMQPAASNQGLCKDVGISYCCATCPRAGHIDLIVLP